MKTTEVLFFFKNVALLKISLFIFITADIITIVTDLKSLSLFFGFLLTFYS
jgi:hypothetical protein